MSTMMAGKHKIGKTAVSLDTKKRKTVAEALQELMASSDSEDLDDETYKFSDLESESEDSVDLENSDPTEDEPYTAEASTSARTTSKRHIKENPVQDVVGDTWSVDHSLFSEQDTNFIP